MSVRVSRSLVCAIVLICSFTLCYADEVSSYSSVPTVVADTSVVSDSVAFVDTVQNIDSLKNAYLVLDSNFRVMNDQYTQVSDHQFKALKVHKALAFTTGGLLLAADGMGLYHFLSMKKQGHDYRAQVGMTDSNQTNGMENVWRTSQSQSERVIHAGLVSLGTITYTTTAAIELALPNMSTSKKKFSNTAIHRKAFYLHASLMASNIALGLLTSYALSEGKHQMVQGLGVAHLVVGFAAPVSMMGAGLIFKIPNEY